MDRKQTIRQLCDEMAKEAAKKIGASAWYDHADKVLTGKEKAEVKSVWDQLPGSSSWMNAFLAWYNAL